MNTIKTSTRTLRTGNVVAYPTESFFALGADATNTRAVRKVFRLKGREKKPIALIAGSVAQVERFFVVSAAERRLMKRYWPPFDKAHGRGAVTIVLKPKAGIATRALFGLTTPSRRAPRSGHPSSTRRGIEGSPRIGVRVPRHATARKLALAFGKPITATSANISGHKPTKLHTVVARTFRGIVMVNGACGASKKPSTVVSTSQGTIQVLRRGAVNVK